MCVFFPLATAWFKLIAKEICPLGDQNCETGRVSKHGMAAKTGLEMERVPPYPLVYHHFPKQNGEESRHLCYCYLCPYCIYIYVCVGMDIDLAMFYHRFWCEQRGARVLTLSQIGSLSYTRVHQMFVTNPFYPWVLKSPAANIAPHVRQALEMVAIPPDCRNTRMFIIYHS